MIEDALKATRTLHRLLITVSLVTLVFALSIDPRSSDAVLKRDVDKFIVADFQAYDEFVKQQVDTFTKAKLVPLGENLNASLEAQGHSVFNLHHIGEAAGKPLHVGKLLMDELVLSNVSDASLYQFEGLAVLPLDRDVQVIVPMLNGLGEQISNFLGSHPGAGKRIDNPRFLMNESNFIGESFLPGGDFTYGVYFKLSDPVLTPGAPEFDHSLDGRAVFLPNTSFKYWLQQVDALKGLVEIAGDGSIVFAPALKSASKEFNAEKLGVLSGQLAQKIADSGPEKQSVSILGTKVPGLLVIFAAPLTLAALGYYLFMHCAHLIRLVPSDPKSFQHFAWLPLVMQRTWRAPLRLSRWQLPAWVVESFTTMVLLPLVALIILLLRLQQFGGISWPSLTSIVLGCFAVTAFGISSIRSISELRMSVVSAES